MSQPSRRFAVVDFDQVPPVPCPCGQSQRALANVDAAPCTVHRTRIDGEAEAHYHKQHTEIYYVLQCDPEARIELDGQSVPLRPGMCVMIPPGVVHRAVGRLTILNIVFPKFDPGDEVLVK